MKLLVVGAGGQVARALSRMSSADVIVIALGRPTVDLEKIETLEAALNKYRPDVVACVGAYTAVDLAESEPEVAMRINAEGPGCLAAKCAQRGVPIILVSTDYVFDGAKNDAYVEADPVAPQSAYGHSKAEGERLVNVAQPDHAILRTSWVYAETGRNFVRTMLRLAKSRSSVGVVGDQWGAPTYASHIAQGIAAVARNLSQSQAAELRGVFHMAGAGYCTWADFARAIFAGSAVRGGPQADVTTITTAEFPTLARRPRNSRLDCTKLARVHEVTIPAWQNGLDACLDAISANGWELDA